MSEPIRQIGDEEQLAWEHVRLFMRRPSLIDLPPYPSLPEGLVLRNYHPGDRQALAELLARAFREPWDAALVQERLDAAPDVVAIYVVAQGPRVVATASARLMPQTYPDAGYVHWVATDPDFQGKGLGTLITLRVLAHFRDLRLQSAVLETHSFRLPAQRTYLRLGFVPEARDRDEQVRWSRALPRHLGNPERWR